MMLLRCEACLGFLSVRRGSCPLAGSCSKPDGPATPCFMAASSSLSSMYGLMRLSRSSSSAFPLISTLLKPVLISSSSISRSLISFEYRSLKKYSPSAYIRSINIQWSVAPQPDYNQERRIAYPQGDIGIHELPLLEFQWCSKETPGREYFRGVLERPEKRLVQSAHQSG